jgi:DNA repair exonuclease SbcCD nuclease subunit
VVICHNSDWHLGERIDADEVNGWNSFDVETCQSRVKRFVDATCELGRRWLGTTKCDGVLYTLGGDLTSGDIHDELSRTNELETLPSVRLAAGLAVASIRRLADEFGRVHVMAVPGNHGRTTRKPTAKRMGALSYDIMAAHLAAQSLESDARISFQIAAGADAATVLYSRLVLLTHGDNIGTKGGMGFAGPVLPIIRGGHKISAQFASADVAPDLILMGHYHTSAAPPHILANGSIPGMSEYGLGLRAALDVPRQWAALFHSRWGLTSRCDVQLEDPPPRPKPRVRAA